VRRGGLIGGVIMVLMLALLNVDAIYQQAMPGPMNSGHENLDCKACHQKAAGSLRQQIQANVRYLMGGRERSVAFNFISPGNDDCLSCHERDNDHHPVYRFNEPRFSEVRQAIAPQLCAGCHLEHSGVRITSAPDNCKNCHSGIQVRNDPLDITHEDLIALENWHSCLRCHDYHGNHIMVVPASIKAMKPIASIEEYFSGGADPYSDVRYHQARTTRDRNTQEGKARSALAYDEEGAVVEGSP